MTHFLKKSFAYALLTSMAFITLSAQAFEDTEVNPALAFVTKQIIPMVYPFPNFVTTHPTLIPNINGAPTDRVIVKITGKLSGGSIGGTMDFQAIQLSENSYLAQADTNIHRKGVFFSIDSSGKIRATHSRYCFLSECKDRNLTLNDRGGYVATGPNVLGYGIFDLKISYSYNVARGRTATQSSTFVSHGTGWSASASKAVDGYTIGRWDSGTTSGYHSVSSTNEEQGAWWQVDLANVIFIRQIRIFNRTDCCKDRLTNYRVTVSNRSNRRDIVYQEVFSGYPDPEQIIDFGLQGVLGQYVSIQLLGKNTLSLAEVQVMGNNIRYIHQ